MTITRATTVFTHDRLKKPAPKPFANKPKRWNHQDDLDRLKGRKIMLLAPGEEPASAMMLEADQFTIKVMLDGTDKPVVLFKHALAGFGEIEVAN